MFKGERLTGKQRSQFGQYNGSHLESSDIPEIIPSADYEGQELDYENDDDEDLEESGIEEEEEGESEIKNNVFSKKLAKVSTFSKEEVESIFEADPESIQNTKFAQKPFNRVKGTVRYENDRDSGPKIKVYSNSQYAKRPKFKPQINGPTEATAL